MCESAIVHKGQNRSQSHGIFTSETQGAILATLVHYAHLKTEESREELRFYLPNALVDAVHKKEKAFPDYGPPVNSPNKIRKKVVKTVFGVRANSSVSLI